MNRWEFFSEQELSCRGTDECEMNEEFMEKLVRLRKKFNKPMIISSGFRSQAHNSAINGARHSPHLLGRAVDILCHGKDAYRLIGLAIDNGMTGIGVQQRGDYESRFIHVDDIVKSKVHHRPWIWSYK